MTTAAPPTTTDDAAAQQSAELAAMRRMLGIARGSFSLSFAVCNSPAERDRLIARLQEGFPDIRVASIPNDSTDPFASVSRQLDSGHPASVFVVNLERAVRSDAAGQNVLQALNASRELWPRSLPCPVVFWLPEYAATLLSTHARDFWRYRSHRFQFDTSPVTSVLPSHNRPSKPAWAATSFSREENEARMTELRRRLVEAGEGDDSELAVYIFLWLAELTIISFSLGMLDEASQYAHKMLERAERVADESAKAMAYGNLGIIQGTRGDLVGAVAMHRKALEIDEKLGRLEGVANQYGNLGNAVLTRGDLDGAEAMYRKALEIDEKLGRPESVANTYANLGIVRETRGDLAGAEAMYRKSLEIYEKLGRPEGMAHTYGNLGNVLGTRGDLAGAEAMYRKSLEIDEKFGRPEGMAHTYAYLGIFLRARGDLTEAKKMWTKSRDLFTRMGAKHWVERVQGWIDRLPNGSRSVGITRSAPTP